MQRRLNLAIALSGLFFAFLPALAVLAGTATERVATGINRAVFATAPPGDTERLFLVEQQSGRIKILNLATNTISPTLYLQVNGLATGNEQGLLGLAFDPDYANNGYFYVNFNTSADGGDTHIRRYTVQGDPAMSNVADAASGVDILVFNQPQTNHNGGWIAFSPNDPVNLYIATGDGGNGNDTGSGHTSGTGNAQDLTNNLLGKMLRINPSREENPTVLYTIPEDNPAFGGRDGFQNEIWAYGLRNPFRDSFDRETGDLWIGDVGQGAREEIDFQPAGSDGGENYGWRLQEGFIQTPGVGGPPPAGYVPPVYDYQHPSPGQPFGPFEGNVVIGGYVYRGPVKEFGGHYIFADDESHNIWKLDPHAVDIPASVTRVNNDLLPDASSIAFIGSFGEDELGNLYILEVFGGEVFKIVSDSEDAVWNGDAAEGAAGDGTNWSDANNWTRGGTVDTGFVSDDSVVFAPGSSQSVIDLEQNRTAAAVTFQAPYTLQNNQLQVLSGNVTVDDGVTAAIESDLVAESANHSIRKLGAGTLLVDGNAGQTAVLAGTIGGFGTFDHLTAYDGATVAPSPTAALDVTNSFTLNGGSTLEIEIGGTFADEYDRVVVGGAASLAGGTLAVSLVDLGEGEYVPGAGDSFSILSANGGFDDFGGTDLPDLAPGLVWQLNPGGATLFLDVAIQLPGDYNLDGVVNAADFVMWRNSEGDSVDVPGTLADGDADGTVNQGDYLVWMQNFGAVLDNAAAAAVPEPTAAALLVLGLLLGPWRVARRNAF